jgi:hypothetical protein
MWVVVGVHIEAGAGVVDDPLCLSSRGHAAAAAAGLLGCQARAYAVATACAVRRPLRPLWRLF